MTPACGGRGSEAKGPAAQMLASKRVKEGSETARLDEAVEAMAARGREA